MRQPQGGTGQRLPGLRHHVTQQWPAQLTGPHGQQTALLCADASGNHDPAFIPPLWPVIFDGSGMLLRVM
ncbi:hypothetical protein D3C71_1857600 [compost metagenome]